MNKRVKTLTTRATAVAAALTAVGAVAATASPAQAEGTAAGPAPVVHNLTEVTNMTPYTWTVWSSGMWGMKTGPYDIAPPQTVAPGQTASWAAWHSHDSQDIDLTQFSFTDAAGKEQLVQIEDGGDGFDGDHASSFSSMHSGNQIVESPDFHMAMDPDGVTRHFDAVWNTPTTIKIDAKADPAAAALAVNTQFPQATAGSTTFVYPQGEQPTVTLSDSHRASDQVINESSKPVTLYKGHEVERGESTSLGEEVTASVSESAFGFAAKAAVSQTSDKEWGIKDKIVVDDDMDIPSGQMGWWDMDTAVSTMTGDLQFTTPGGITYQITNVSIHEPGIAPVAGAPTGVDFTPDDGAIPAGM